MCTLRVVAAVAILGALAILTACAALGAERSPQPAALQPAAEAPPAGQTPWQYPIAAGVWYPCDGSVPEHAFRYYKVRCWPGCHDPNSQPQPHP